LKIVNFIFGIHNHQPVGNFDFVMEYAYRQSYLPFIEIVEEFSDIHITFHFSGCLLEWLDAHYPDYLDRIAALVARGNVEIISGGFFEPVLAMIPDADKVGQIRMMNDYIQKRFNYPAKGLWLTERVWEPHLAKPIAEAGIKYITVDDYHFLSNGKQESELTGHFLTEEQGKTLGIFPISQRLRYTIPFQEPQATIDHLAKFATEDAQTVVVMADDGEKFGVWPGTHEQVFTKGWLRSFFTALRKNSEWLKTLTFAEWYEKHPPKGRIYLPTASYFEMSEWSLPWAAGEKFADLVHEFEHKNRIEEARPFIKGGIWRNFLFKYDESNWMQKKMLNLSERINRVNVKELTDSQRRELEQVRLHLWRGTCNCAYWHGIFGGLYLPHLRHAIYSELLTGERLLNKILGEKGFRAEVFDFDADGEDEIVVDWGNLHTIIAPHRGGMITELSMMDKAFNLLNGIQRYRESYHRKVVLADSEENSNAGGSIHDLVLSKEKGLEKYLKYDKYPRKTLVDHIIHLAISLEKFRDGEYFEDSDFIMGRYHAELDEKSRTLTLNRQGWINWQKFEIKKTIVFEKSSLKITYTLTNANARENVFRFGPEFNFALLGGDSPDRYYIADGEKTAEPALNSTGVLARIKALGVVNEWDKFKAEVIVPQATEFWRFPVETVSLSEAGFERIYQSSVIIPWFDVRLKAGETVTYNIDLVMSSL
jgi:alpha-amylase